MSDALGSPPDLPGFQFERLLGSGGFADVFLYRQSRPNREVAVKVLRHEMADRRTMEALMIEADLMGAISNHPYIVSLYMANIASDGRAYMVMEYYPQPHFGIRARQQALSIAEVLRVGIQLAGAVETAHRSAILHRDIKPANVLTSRFGQPGLTDFGLGSASVSPGTEQSGLTVAYCAPEILSELSHGSVASDVYSLGATLWAMLAGRAPFTAPGGDGSAAAILRRALHDDPQAMGRGDVPESLDRLLLQTLSKTVDERPPSAIALGRALQRIEQELALRTTPIDVQSEEAAPEWPEPAETPDDELDRNTVTPAEVRSESMMSMVTWAPGPLPAEQDRDVRLLAETLEQRLQQNDWAPVDEVDPRLELARSDIRALGELTKRQLLGQTALPIVGEIIKVLSEEALAVTDAAAIVLETDSPQLASQVRSATAAELAGINHAQELAAGGSAPRGNTGSDPLAVAASQALSLLESLARTQESIARTQETMARSVPHGKGHALAAVALGVGANVITIVGELAVTKAAAPLVWHTAVHMLNLLPGIR